MNAAIQPFARVAVLLLAVVGFGFAWSGDQQAVSHFPVARRAALENALTREAAQTPAIAPLPKQHALPTRELSCIFEAIQTGRRADARIETVYRIEADGEGWREIAVIEVRPVITDEPAATRIRKPMRITDIARTLISGAATLIR